MKRIVIHIEKMVLRGFDHVDASTFAEGLRGELARQLARSGALGTLPSTGAVTQLPSSTVHLPTGSPSRSAGTRTARALARSFRT